MAYAKCATLVTDHTQCGGSDSSNFTIPFDEINASWKSAAHGGQIQHSTTVGGITVPCDFVFSSNRNGTVILPFEITVWDDTTGHIKGWYQVPTLSHTTDRTDYVVWDDSSVSTFQGGALGAAWNSGVLANIHGGDGTTPSGTDATANGNNATLVGSPTGVAGQINGAIHLVAASSQKLTIPHTTSLNAYPMTVSAWFKTTDTTHIGALINKYAGGSLNGYNLYMNYLASGHIAGLYFKDGSNYAWPGDPGVDGGSVADGVARLIELVVDSSGARMRVNGTVIASTPWTGTPGACTNTQNVTVGFYSGDYLNADVEEIRIENVARSDDWGLQRYNAESSPATFLTLGPDQSNTGPTKLAITSVNGGSHPQAGVAFSVVIQSQDSGGSAANVTADTPIAMSLYAGTGTLGGTLTGTILSGHSSVTISGVTYTKAESGVRIIVVDTSTPPARWQLGISDRLGIDTKV